MRIYRRGYPVGESTAGYDREGYLDCGGERQFVCRYRRKKGRDRYMFNASWTTDLDSSPKKIECIVLSVPHEGSRY